MKRKKYTKLYKKYIYKLKTQVRPLKLYREDSPNQIIKISSKTGGVSFIKQNNVTLSSSFPQYSTQTLSVSVLSHILLQGLTDKRFQN